MKPCGEMRDDGVGEGSVGEVGEGDVEPAREGEVGVGGQEREQ